MHWQHIKQLINTCQQLIVSDICSTEGVSSATAALMSQAPPPHFCSTVVRLIALQILNTTVSIALKIVFSMVNYFFFRSWSCKKSFKISVVTDLICRVGSI